MLSNIAQAFGSLPIKARTELIHGLARKYLVEGEGMDYISLLPHELAFSLVGIEKISRMIDRPDFYQSAKQVFKSFRGEKPMISTSVAFGSRSLLTPEQQEELFSQLDKVIDIDGRRLLIKGCDGTLTRTRKFLENLSITGNLLENVIEEIKNGGGYCDCEVLMNYASSL